MTTPDPEGIDIISALKASVRVDPLSEIRHRALNPAFRPSQAEKGRLCPACALPRLQQCLARAERDLATLRNQYRRAQRLVAQSMKEKPE